jgi:hypothetical protein
MDNCDNLCGVILITKSVKINNIRLNIAHWLSDIIDIWIVANIDSDNEKPNLRDYSKHFLILIKYNFKNCSVSDLKAQPKELTIYHLS